MKDKYNIKEIKKLRRELHQFPELSDKESNTAGRILRYLKALNPDEIIENIGGHGIACVFKAELTGPSILFRQYAKGLSWSCR